MLNRDMTTHVDVTTLTGSQVDGLLLQASEEEDDKVIFYLLESSTRISRYALERILIHKIKEWKIVEAVHQHVLRNNLDVRWVKPYLSAAYWYKGDSNNAVDGLKRAYFEANNPKERSIVTYLLHDIILYTVGKKSEATSVILAKLTEYLVCIFDDYGPLLSLWQRSFTSEWWSDQLVATDLFVKHVTLRILLSNRVGSLCHAYLSTDNVDACQRLLQLFLQFDQLTTSRTILVILFDYNYLRRDLRACSEIIQFALKMNIQLKDDHSKKLLNLLLKGDGKAVVKPKRKLGPPKFTFKF